MSGLQPWTLRCTCPARTKLCTLLNLPEKPLVGGASTELHTHPTEPGPCLLSLNNARSIPRDKSLDNRWLFMTTRLPKFGASDKSLANLPVTQLLALVPRDHGEESSKMGKTFQS